jgi:hypothetical protein
MGGPTPCRRSRQVAILDYPRTVKRPGSSRLHPGLRARARRGDFREQRGPAWTDYAIAVITECPYASSRRLHGMDGAVAILRAYKPLLDESVRALSFPPARAVGLPSALARLSREDPRVSSDLRHSPVDEELDAGDIAVVVGRQEDCGLDDLVGFSPAPMGTAAAMSSLNFSIASFEPASRSASGVSIGPGLPGGAGRARPRSGPPLRQDANLTFPLVDVDATMVHGWPLLSAALTACNPSGATYATTSSERPAAFMTSILFVLRVRQFKRPREVWRLPELMTPGLGDLDVSSCPCLPSGPGRHRRPPGGGGAGENPVLGCDALGLRAPGRETG